MAHHYNHTGGDGAIGVMAILVKDSICSTPVNLQSLLQVAVVHIHPLTIDFTLCNIYRQQYQQFLPI
jgi:hypothetical protein